MPDIHFQIEAKLISYQFGTRDQRLEARQDRLQKKLENASVMADCS